MVAQADDEIMKGVLLPILKKNWSWLGEKEDKQSVSVKCSEGMLWAVVIRLDEKTVFNRIQSSLLALRVGIESKEGIDKASLIPPLEQLFRESVFILNIGNNYIVRQFTSQKYTYSFVIDTVCEEVTSTEHYERTEKDKEKDGQYDWICMDML